MNTVMQHASPEPKALYMPPMTEDRRACTMVLTTPQCGNDWGQVKNKAEPQPDGSYKITGTKIFISSGDPDLTENLIHIFLARPPDSPPGMNRAEGASPCRPVPVGAGFMTVNIASGPLFSVAIM